jgi:hypothetical protein
MNLRAFFYRQRVTEAELDQVFTWAQDADRAIVLDKDEAGVADGLTLAETGPASMALAYASGVAYAKAGERCNVAVAGTVDCSQDEYGVPTTVTDPANTKWIAIFVRPTRVLSEPRTDGNGNEVYTVQSEAAEVFVRQGSEGIGPAQVGLSASAILLGEVELAFGQTAITTGDIEVDRREDWYRAVTLSFGEKVHGTALDAVGELWAEMDILGAAGGTFTFVSKWFSAVDVAGSAPPITTVAEAINAMVYDLAQATGSGLVGTANVAGTYLNWTTASVAGALSSIATAVNQHIGGSAPQHAATSITYTPYLWIAGATAAAAINEIIEDLALQTDTPGAARIGNVAAVTTVWDWFSQAADTIQAQLAGIFAALNNALPVNVTNVNPKVTVDGADVMSYGAIRGLVAPAPSMSWKSLVQQDYGDLGSNEGVQSSIPWVAPNYRDVATRTWVDVCPGWYWSGRKPCFYAVSIEKACVYKLDHVATLSNGIGNVNILVDWSGTYPTAMPVAVASNGKYLYVLTADSVTHHARMFQYDCYTNPLATPTLYKTTEFSGIHVYHGASTFHLTALCVGTNTLAFTAIKSTGTLSADEFLVVVAQNDITSWSKGQGNIPTISSYSDALGAIAHVGDDTYLYSVYHIGFSKSFGVAAQATVVGGLVTGVVAPASPVNVYDFGSVYIKSATFDGATVWWADEDGVIYAYFHKGSGAAESERWLTPFELNTNNLVDTTSGAPIRLAFDGARVWIFAREKNKNRIVAMSFDPTCMILPASITVPAMFDLTYLNAPPTATWDSDGPTAGEGPGRVAIIADVAMVIGRFLTPDGMLHRLCNLSRRGGRTAP